MNMLNRCAHCKHWKRFEGKYLSEKDKHRGECTLAASHDNTPDHPETLAYATDQESWNAGLITHETFGCVQWAPRD